MIASSLHSWSGRFVRFPGPNAILIACVLMFKLCSASALGSPAQPENSPQEDTNARQPKYAPQPSAVYFSLQEPDRISEFQLEQLASILELSDAQMLAFHDLWEKYLIQEAEFRSNEIRPVHEQSTEITPLRVHGEPPSEAYTQAAVEWWHQRHRVVEQLFQLENTFLHQIRPYLSEVQLLRFERVLDLRVRQRARAIPTRYPASNFDLTEELFRLAESGTKMAPLDGRQFAADLLEYEKAATALYRAALKTRLRPSIEGNIARGRMAAIRNSETDLERRAELELPFRMQKRALHEQIAEINKSIHDLNRTFVQRFAEQLPHATAETLLQGFRETAYGIVYPDPFDVLGILEEAEALETLSAEQSSVIGITRYDYAARRDDLSQKMVEEFLDWSMHTESRNGYEFAAYEQYQGRMHRLQFQRRENAEKALATLRGILDADTLDRLGRRIAEYNRRVDEFATMLVELEGRNRIWPGPYDG